MSSIQRTIIQRDPVDTSEEESICASIGERVASQQEDLRNQRRAGHFVFPPPTYDAYRRLHPLCVAIEQGEADKVPELMDLFLDANRMPLGVLSEALMYQLAVRLRQMNLNDQSERLRTHFEQRSHMPEGALRRTLRFYGHLADFSVSQSQTSSSEDRITSLQFMIASFIPIREAYAGIDRESISYTDHNMMVLRPHITLWEYHNGLLRHIRTLFNGIHAAIQSIMATAITELENTGNSVTLTSLNTILTQDLHPAIFGSNPGGIISDISMEITDTDIQRPGHGNIRDSFRSDDRPNSRDLPVSTYNPSHEYSRELSSSIGHLYGRRIRQIQALGQLYGQQNVLDRERPLSGDFDRADDSERNAAAIAQMQGPLRLHNNDDWRRFLLQKFQDMVSPPTGSDRLRRSPSEAFSALINIISTYLSAFTVHARYSNVYEIGDNYLNRNFPRALSGQLVHDCGVYALRIAYMLSLVRNEIGLNFRFVRLPEHIALVIYGPNVPAVVVNNDRFVTLTSQEWTDIQDRWRLQNSQSPTTEDQFVGEIAARNYISGPIDMPFRVDDAPAMNEHDRLSRNRLWQFYQTTVSRGVLGRAASSRNNENYQFGQRYRDVIERQRMMHNELLVPYWNVHGPAAWLRFRTSVESSANQLTINREDLIDLLHDYEFENDEALSELEGRHNAIVAEKQRIRTILENHPELVANGAGLTDGLRFDNIYSFYWEQFRNRLSGEITTLMSNNDDTVLITPTLNRLNPPFIPVSEEALSRID